MRKIFFLFIIIVLSFMSINADSLSTYNTNDTVTRKAQKFEEIQEDSTDVVSGLTLVVNTVNNIITWTTAIITIFTLVVALFGFFGYRHIMQSMEKSIAENEKIIGKRLEELNMKEKEFNDGISLTKAVSEKIDAQEKYMCKANQYLYEALDKIANQIKDISVGKIILKDMLHNFQVTNLYSSEGKKVFAALAYLQENGTPDDIEHLEFYSCHNEDANSYSSWAREIIGVIKHKHP